MLLTTVRGRKMLSLNKPFTHIQPVARLSCAAVIIAAIMVNFGCSSDSGKANRTNPVPIVDSFTEEVVVYNGPTPISQSVLNFKVNFWDNVALQSRCGGCHVEGDQQPAFARADDINLAHDLVLNDGWILLSEPASSPLVEKVASGHQCWLSDPSACEEKFVEWIRAWADDSGVEVTESSLRVPEVQEVSASLTYSETSGGFQTHVYPLLADFTLALGGAFKRRSTQLLEQQLRELGQCHGASLRGLCGHIGNERSGQLVGHQ